MAQPTIIKLDNFTQNNVIEDSYLIDDAIIGATELTIKDPQAFSGNFFVMIGTLGLENTEIRQVQSVANNVLTVPGLDRNHLKYDKITLLSANKMKIWRATAPTDGTQPAIGTFAVYGDPIDIDYDNLTTRYVDTAGGPGFWYGYTFLNSITTATSDLQESDIIRGGSVNDYTTVVNIRREAGFDNNRNITDNEIALARAEAQAQVNALLVGRYVVPFTDPINPLIERITKVLAAGYLLKEQYGTFGTSDTTNGDNKVNWAMGLLGQLKSGDVVLTNPDGTIPEVPDDGNGVNGDLGFSAWPNGTTEQADGSDGFMFERNNIDGYHGRAY